MCTLLVFTFIEVPSKVHADAINDLQYPRAKMATKSEMLIKFLVNNFFGEKLDYKHRVSRKTAP